MKKAKKIIAFVLVLVMAAALLSGCGETGSTGSTASGKTYNLAYQCARYMPPADLWARKFTTPVVKEV